jgi:acyl carrier protein
VNASLSRPDIESELRRVLADACGKDLSQVGADVDLVRALGLDSLALLRLAADVEVRLGIRLPDSSLSHLRTIRQFVGAIEAGNGSSFDPPCGESLPVLVAGRGA